MPSLINFLSTYSSVLIVVVISGQYGLWDSTLSVSWLDRMKQCPTAEWCLCSVDSALDFCSVVNNNKNSSTLQYPQWQLIGIS